MYIVCGWHKSIQCYYIAHLQLNLKVNKLSKNEQATKLWPINSEEIDTQYINKIRYVLYIPENEISRKLHCEECSSLVNTCVQDISWIYTEFLLWLFYSYLSKLF